jgi:dTDP-4-dehydrorhamnose reductase
MVKILIIGKKSFLGSNLNNYLKVFFKVDIFSYEEIIKKNLSFFKTYTHIINTAIHKNYVKNKYNIKFDLDRKFITNFKKINFSYIFLNSRKIYSPKENITENTRPKPVSNYGKNKFITESFLKYKLKKNLISLRISNIIGKRIFRNNRSNHKIFFDNFTKYKKKNKEITVDNDFKDFLTINQFCYILRKIISNNKIHGIFNVSLSQKIYISEIVSWLDRKFKKKIIFEETRKDSFTLSNKKLLKKIQIKLHKKDLEKFCNKLVK